MNADSPLKKIGLDNQGGSKKRQKSTEVKGPETSLAAIPEPVNEDGKNRLGEVNKRIKDLVRLRAEIRRE